MLKDKIFIITPEIFKQISDHLISDEDEIEKDLVLGHCNFKKFLDSYVYPSLSKLSKSRQPDRKKLSTLIKIKMIEKEQPKSLKMIETLYNLNEEEEKEEEEEENNYTKIKTEDEKRIKSFHPPIIIPNSIYIKQEQEESTNMNNNNNFYDIPKPLVPPPAIFKNEQLQKRTNINNNFNNRGFPIPTMIPTTQPFIFAPKKREFEETIYYNNNNIENLKRRSSILVLEPIFKPKVSENIYSGSKRRKITEIELPIRISSRIKTMKFDRNYGIPKLSDYLEEYNILPPLDLCRDEKSRADYQFSYSFFSRANEEVVNEGNVSSIVYFRNVENENEVRLIISKLLNSQDPRVQENEIRICLYCEFRKFMFIRFSTFLGAEEH